MKVESIPISSLLPPLYPVRRVADDGQMQELVRSIATTGLLHPLVVTPENGQYRILAGHRRFIACKGLGWEEIPCHILEIGLRERSRVTITENLVREKVNPVDLAWFLRHLIEDEGMTQTEIAERLGYTPAWCSQMVKLTTMDEDVQVAIQQGRLSVQAAQQLYRIKNEDTRDVYTRDAIARELSGPTVRANVENLLRYEDQVNQAVQTSQEVRTQIAVDTDPLACRWCGSLAREAPGNMIWLCNRCLEALERAQEGTQPEQG